MPAFALSPTERATYRRYADLALPRHTSYPASPVWETTYGPAEFAANLRQSAACPLSLYVHVPFCEKLCYYCACTKEIVPNGRRRQHDPSDTFLAGLEREASRLVEILGSTPIQQLHLGGGSPTFLRVNQLERLWTIFGRRFTLAADAEIAIEIDPRITTYEQLRTLRSLGFNRISLGVQDFDETVQRAVNRVQPFEQVCQVVEWVRALKFSSVNFDLIYGLPHQTLATMAHNLEKTLSLAPDRIAFFRLAVIPEIFRWQNTFCEADLPCGDLSLDLNLLAVNRFLDAGYQFIGLDHFARPDEPLSQARQQGTLQRNFQGMTTGKDLTLIGLGPSAISQLDGAFAQNHKTTAEWGAAIDTGLATARGLALSPDDRIRRELLQQIYGHGVVDKRVLERRFAIDFDDYFADELIRLRRLAEDGLVEMEQRHLRLTAVLGRLLVRVVAAVFDCYLAPDAYCCGVSPQQASRVG